MIITTLLKDKHCSNCIENDVNSFLADNAKKLLYNLRFGIDICKNENSIFLSDLLSILQAKRKGAECFASYDDKKIIRIIKKLMK